MDNTKNGGGGNPYMKNWKLSKKIAHVGRLKRGLRRNVRI